MNAPSSRTAVRSASVAFLLLIAIWHSGFAATLLWDSEGLASFGDVLAGFGSPDFSGSFLSRIKTLAIESFLIGVLGTALALLVASFLAIAAAEIPGLEDDPAHSPSRVFTRHLLRVCARGILTFFRSIPEIIWAYLFVRIFGLGPGPAVFAIGITFGGIIGKLFAELIEAADPAPARHLRATGAGSVAVFVYGVLPLVRRQWVAYTIFRLECAIRSASILGVVGAGGLGQEIDLSMRYFQYDKLATALLAVFAYVVVLEIAGIYLRKIRPAWPVACLVFASILALFHLDIPWHELTSAESLKQAKAFLSGFAHPTTTWPFIKNALHLVLLTVSMAWVATIIAAVLAFVLAPMAATTFTVRGYLVDAPRGRGWFQWAFLLVLVPLRLTLQVTRALPELVWALLFIVWVGPGVTAGILALTVHTFGILGRLYSDVFEEAEPAPARTLEASGAGPLARYLCGVLPQVMPRMLAFTLFRFEVNVRAAAMLGFVGAGGLGDALHTAISLFHMNDLAALLLVSLAVIVIIDSIGDWLRMRLIRG
ncbi:MAG: ABC transporter permease subunit [Kofleriaceae bacterium]|nr:ABC transporter permease subunit [Kofleriaceae bacterium]